MKPDPLIKVENPREFAKVHGLVFNEAQYSALANTVAFVASVHRHSYSGGGDIESSYPVAAGGSVSRVFREEPIGGDIDVYGPLTAFYSSTIARLSMNAPDKERHNGAYTSTVFVRDSPMPVNFIYNTPNDPADILSSFDMNLVRLAYDAFGVMWVHPAAVSDLKNKEFTYTKDSAFFAEFKKKFPHRARRRAEKYFAMGFTSPDVDFVDLLSLGDSGLETVKAVEETEEEEYEAWATILAYFTNNKYAVGINQLAVVG